MRFLKISKYFFSLFFSVVTVILLTVNTGAVCINGDVDNDTIFSTEDARLALCFVSDLLSPTEEQFNAADANRDGYITTEDAVIILRLASGVQKPSTHEYTDWEIVEDATCTNDGYAVCTCTLCKKTFTKILYAEGHIPVGLSCTENGICETCDEVIPAPGHTFVNGTCSVCDFSKKQPNITYKNKTIKFYSTSESIISILGKPCDTLTDATVHGTLKILVYYSNYKDLGIFTFFDNKLSQFYTNNLATVVEHKNKRYSLKGSTVSDSKLYIGDITIEPYVDEVDNKTYSFLATVEEKYEYADTSDFTANEKLILHLVNGCRALHKCPPLLYSEKAHNSAYKHSLDMASNNYFSHIGLNGSDPGDRMSAEGIAWHMYAENIAAGYPDAYYQNNGWYNSTGHRANMLIPDLEYLGVGIAYKKHSTYRYYATENFFSY